MKNNTEKQNKSANTKVGTEELRDQNSKIAFITDDMMVIGVDVGSENHYARAFTNRKIELSSKPFKFTNTKDGFDAFKAWGRGSGKKEWNEIHHRCAGADGSLLDESGDVHQGQRNDSCAG